MMGERTKLQTSHEAYDDHKLVEAHPTISDDLLGLMANSPRIDTLVKDGVLELSLKDAIALSLENNLDIAIARYNIPIAAADVLRTRRRTPRDHPATRSRRGGERRASSPAARA